MIKNQKGQGTIEAVLILVIIVGFGTLVSTTLRNNDTVATVVSAPWKQLAGLIQNGKWGTPEDTKSYHPHHNHRHSTPRGAGGQ